MPRKVKPKAFPEWLLEGGPHPAGLFDYPVCRWICTGCGAPYFYRQKGTRHGGPPWRIKGRPEWSPFEGPCWRSHDYGVKCVSPKGVRVLVHQGCIQPGEELMKDLAANARRVRARLKKEAELEEQDAA